MERRFVEQQVRDNKLPIGNIKIIAHRGGEYDVTTGTIVGGEEIERFEEHNVIAANASMLFSRHLYPDGATFSGLQYLAVGTGVGTGDTQNPQAEDETYTKLRVEIFRKVFSSYTYLDETGNSVASPTKRFAVTTTLLEAEANGALVEMGLYGGNATDTKDSGYLFNYKVFSVINKDNTMRITVIWDIAF